MSEFSFIQLADPQFGMWAGASGLSDEKIAELAEQGTIFPKTPEFTGFAPETELFTRAIERANWLKPAFVVVCGDMINNSDNDEQVAEVKRIAALLNDSIDLHWVAGNHDIAVDHITPTAESISRYRDIFGPDYYAFSYGNARFIVMNSTIFHSPKPIAEEVKAQMAFIEAEAIISQKQGTRHIVLFSHHPLFIETPNETNNPWSIKKRYRKELIGIALEFGIKINFAGHWHRNNIVEQDGIEVVTSGAVGLPLWHDPSGFRVVKVGFNAIMHEYHSLESG